MQISAPTLRARATIKALEEYYHSDRPLEAPDVVFDTFERISMAHGAISLPDMPNTFKVRRATDTGPSENFYMVHVMWFQAVGGNPQAFTAIIYDSEANRNLMCDDTDPDYPEWLEHRVTAILGYLNEAETEKASVLCH